MMMTVMLAMVRMAMMVRVRMVMMAMVRMVATMVLPPLYLNGGHPTPSEREISGLIVVFANPPTGGKQSQYLGKLLPFSCV